MTPEPSGPPPLFRWLRDHPVCFATTTGIVMILAGIAIFSDARPALAGGAVSAVLIYAAWRPGGFGWSLDAHQRRLLEERGDLGVRSSWLRRATLGVVGFVLLAVLLAMVAL